MVHGIELEEASSDVSSTKALMTVVSRQIEELNDGHERQNIRLTAVRPCSKASEMTRIRLLRSSDIKVDGILAFL